MRKLVVVMAVALLAGCASTEVVGTVPSPGATAAIGRVTVCRKRIFVGDGVATIISIDGNAVLRSGPGVCFSANLTTGTHTISVLGHSWAGPNIGKKTFVIHADTALYFAVKNEEVEQVKAAYIENLLHSNYKMVNVQ